MLSLSGNTAPYMLYAYVRIMGIRRKAEAVGGSDSNNSIDYTGLEFKLDSPEELTLLKQIIRFQDILREVEKDLYPNKICEYLFELSQKFNQFYENCPVLKAENDQIRMSRTALCTLTADTIKLGLELLGIDTVDKL